MYHKTTYDQDFDDLYMYLKAKYPSKLFDLAGIGVQTDMGLFSKKFFSDITTTADGSVDANSNVDDLTVVAYENELPKPFTRLNSLYLLWKYGKKLFGKEYANTMIEKELTGAYYINDLSNVQKPYSYTKETVLIIKDGDNIELLSMEELFNKYQTNVNVLPDREEIYLKDKNLKVLEKNRFVDLWYVLRHKTQESIITIETQNGAVTRVTADHPVVLSDGSTKPACEITCRDELMCFNPFEETNVVGSTRAPFTIYKDEKEVPNNIFDYDYETIVSYLGQIIDKNHSIAPNTSAICIKSDSWEFINKLSEIVKAVDLGEVKVTPDKRVYILLNSVKYKNYSEFVYKNCNKLYNDRRSFNDTKGKPAYVRSITSDQDHNEEYVYDITTESGLFYSQGLIQHNCYNFSTYDLMTKGLPFVKKIASGPAKHLSSFVGQLIHFTSYASNQVMGAVGLADLLIVMSYYVKKEFEENPNIPEEYIWKQVKQEIQSVIYSCNQPFRGGLQSGFYNISVYDDYFLDSLSNDYLFPDGSNPDKEIVKKLQNIYLDLMNETMTISPITFPVTTACFCVDKDRNVLEKEFLDYISKKNLMWAFINIYAGESSTLSSCCFAGDQKFISNKGVKPFHYFSDGDKIIVPSHDGTWQNATVHTYGVQQLYKVTLEYNGKEIVVAVTKDHTWILNNRNRTNNLNIGFTILKTPDFLKEYTPTNKTTLNEIVESLKLGDEYDNIHEWKVKSIEPTNRKELVWCLEVDNNHSFILDGGIVTGNCRLRSDKNNKYLGYVNSFGSGGTQIGSFGVVTLNLPQIAIKSKGNIDKFFELLEENAEYATKINHTKRYILEKRISKQALPLYDYGFMNLSRQYSTVGM